MHSLAQKALLGYGFVPTPGNPVLKDHKYKVQFQKYNKRPLDETSVSNMTNVFLASGAEYWRFPVPIIVEKDWIDADRLAKMEDVLGDPRVMIPDVEWTDAVKGKSVEHLGGRHRFRAMDAALVDARKILQDRLKKRDQGRLKQGSAAWMKKNGVVEEQEEKMKHLGRWIAAVYDTSE